MASRLPIKKKKGNTINNHSNKTMTILKSAFKAAHMTRTSKKKGGGGGEKNKNKKKKAPAEK